MPSSGAPGSGGPITSDGSVVEIYRRVSGDAEVQVIAAMLDPASSVLDLGSGVGRIANPLSELGHQITAVDDSADMLAHVRPGRTVRARIEHLRLAEKFDAVLLASSLINYPGVEFRRRLLATIAHLSSRKARPSSSGDHYSGSHSDHRAGTSGPMVRCCRR
ncbi:class I SAM-dependent methyltransferase [Mycobacterium kansasii]